MDGSLCEEKDSPYTHCLAVPLCLLLQRAGSWGARRAEEEKGVAPLWFTWMDLDPTVLKVKGKYFHFYQLHYHFSLLQWKLWASVKLSRPTPPHQSSFFGFFCLFAFLPTLP